MFGGNVRPSQKSVHDTTRGGGNGEPEPEAKGITQGSGDGFHHHTIDENESGFHSVHTHPDGREEHADHGTYEEAAAHQDRMMGHDDQGADDGGEEHMQHGSD